MEVNGARIERAYLDENVAEARSNNWSRATETLLEHVHCMVCGISIDGAVNLEYWKSKNGHLCDYCHTHFIVPGRTS